MQQSQQFNKGFSQDSDPITRQRVYAFDQSMVTDLEELRSLLPICLEQTLTSRCQEQIPLLALQMPSLLF